MLPGTTLYRRMRFARRHLREAARRRAGEPDCGILPAPVRPEPARWPESRLSAAWLGHATVLLRFGGRWVLTDPALRTRIGLGLGPLTFGPRRLQQPALRARELPPLDLLLISHAHMDHLDQGTLRLLPRSVPVIAPRGTRDLLRRFHSVTELDWGERTEAAGISVEAIPARHWGARMITDTHRGYAGFLLQHQDRRVVYTGDTAHHDGYRDLGATHPVDLAIVPIGAYDPWIANHASPEQAWDMAGQLRARHVLPVHHATFRLSREPTGEPIARLLAVAGEERHRVVLTRVGESWHLG